VDSLFDELSYNLGDFARASRKACVTSSMLVCHDPICGVAFFNVRHNCPYETTGLGDMIIGSLLLNPILKQSWKNSPWSLRKSLRTRKFGQPIWALYMKEISVDFNFMIAAY
jgi:hypothetical protein